MEKKTLVPYSTYMLVWFSLILLTGITVLAASLHFGELSTVIALLIAAFKTILVALIFMNLRFEKPLFRRLVLGVIIILAVLLILTYADVLIREVLP